MTQLGSQKMEFVKAPEDFGKMQISVDSQVQFAKIKRVKRSDTGIFGIFNLAAFCGKISEMTCLGIIDFAGFPGSSHLSNADSGRSVVSSSTSGKVNSFGSTFGCLLGKPWKRTSRVFRLVFGPLLHRHGVPLRGPEVLVPAVAADSHPEPLAFAWDLHVARWWLGSRDLRVPAFGALTLRLAHDGCRGPHEVRPGLTGRPCSR
ncbi:hypothetical protein MUK42_10365 [Musa troglodytarum]|uniref:Uncharacterized protein n=1 Tax=Musa troglodytarum TaxID=320322 RepID=A0A9E7JW95_9LILI|nr:hypothetical protein MUK42_10365 [Musa troglodytarum]